MQTSIQEQKHYVQKVCINLQFADCLCDNLTTSYCLDNLNCELLVVERCIGEFNYELMLPELTQVPKVPAAVRFFLLT